MVIRDTQNALYRRTLEVIAMSMLRPVRGKAGLGCPPSPYYTNDIESKITF